MLMCLLFFLFGVSFAMEGLEIGKSMNIFARYGFMGVSMKVIGRPQPWIFREPTTDVFEDIENCTISFAEKKEAIFNGDFHMEMCDDVVQLLEAYFREFKIEQMEEPWKAFTATWSNELIARNFGINITYISDSYCYVLVRLSRYKESKQFKSGIGSKLKPLQRVKESADQIKEGDLHGVGNFVKSYGSHFINSYITGDSLYQVIVYHPPVYYRLKRRFRRTGIASLSKSEMHALFSPWYADHVGSILSASGNSDVVEWANSVLKSGSFINPYSSLLKLYRNGKLLSVLDKTLKNSAILSLELKTLTPIFNSAAKNWFIEVISNIMALWENNMWLFF